MTIKQTIWRIEPHTQAKHAILKDYLNATSRYVLRHSQPIGIQMPKMPELISNLQDIDKLLTTIK